MIFLLPETWAADPSYDGNSGKSYAKSDVIIDNNYPSGYAPFARTSKGKCGVGDPTGFIRFSPQHFLDTSTFVDNYGTHAKVSTRMEISVL